MDEAWDMGGRVVAPRRLRVAGGFHCAGCEGVIRRLGDPDSDACSRRTNGGSGYSYTRPGYTDEASRHTNSRVEHPD